MGITGRTPTKTTNASSESQESPRGIHRRTTAELSGGQFGQAPLQRLALVVNEADGLERIECPKRVHRGGNSNTINLQGCHWSLVHLQGCRWILLFICFIFVVCNNHPSAT